MTATADVAVQGPLTEALARIAGAMRETATVPLAHRTLDLHAKLEYANPNGSSKDRSAYWILKRGVERGHITERTTVVESSSGNFALSMASFCRALGIAFIPVIDPNVNASTEAYLRLTCDRVEKVTERDATGGFLATRLTRVATLRAELPDVFWPDQYGNPDAVEAHYLLTGGELVRALPRIDYAFIGAGTGGTIGGVSLRLKEAHPRVRVVAVDAEGSAIFGGAPKTRRIPGLGSSIVPPLIHRASVDDVVLVSEPDTVRGCHDLLREHGLYAGGSTGTVYSALTRYFAGHTGSRPTVVFLAADRGTAYADTVYNPAWAATLLDPVPA
ncbi:2,3-diaminopropionate biosynthesis protein SbnA [Actinokineospora sp. PR83]|uniref:2,3-diaminopropionate biosynthesis protein SbnA n=1 Tax=Actinokineospora sp. PR83 TaxID=2884908 RepID=UPI0027DF7F03|nr:2,3-diaminopropionate biosynthesis protein SbnA [Actinokineospora sp. PR83]MCG8914789.1 2,3-diaminopropionate biosynthesis protein SbnA [Actinokineospora sp. PR83]